MTGVEILAVNEVVVEFTLNMTAFWITVGACVFIGLVASVFSVITDYCDWMIIPVMTVFTLIAGAILGLLLGLATETPTKYETQYKVTISDEVSMTDFLEKYEIVDSEGKIYTVVEKTEGDN